MKRVMNFLLSIMLTMTLLPMSYAQTEVQAEGESEILYGDANHDQTVNLEDINLMTRYTAGESDAISSINLVNADVNADGAVDATDINLVKEFLVGNIILKPEFRIISFDTDGGDPIAAVKTGLGYTYKGTIPNPAKKGNVFLQWVKEDGSTYYQSEDVINSDLKLTAVYEPLELSQTLQITSFSLTDQPTDVSFNVTGNYSSAAEVEANIKLLPKDGSDPVSVKAEANSTGGFRIYAPSGFKPGATYELTLNSGLNFKDKDEMFRTCSFIIKKDENDNLKFNSNVIFIQDTAAMKYTIAGGSGNPVDILQADLLSSNTSNDPISGTFTMPGGTLNVGDIVCIYQTTSPKDRDYTSNNYDNDASAYLRITSADQVNGVFGFESLNESSAEEVLEMPESILYQVAVLPAQNGTVNKNDYDANARTQLGITTAPKFNINDFLVFYTGTFDEAKKASTAVYGQITAVNGDQVSYKLVNKEDIENFMGMFVKQGVSASQVVNNLKASSEALASVQTQVQESGFAGLAAQNMTRSALNTPEVQTRMRDNGVSEEDIQALASASDPIQFEDGGASDEKRTTVKVEKVTVVPTFEIGTHFKDGIGLNLEVEVVISIETKINATTQSDLKIVLSAGFEEEVKFSIDVDVDDQWNWYGPIPVLEDLNVNASLDIENYSSVSVCAKIYTISEDIKQEWSDIEENAMGINASPEVKKAIRKANELGAKAKKKKADGEDDTAIKEEIKALLATKVVINEQEYSLEQIEAKLKGEDVSESFNDVLNAKTRDASKTGLEQLMDRYKKMLDQESDWVQLLNKEIFSKEFHIKVVAIKVSLNFLIKANVNIAIGADVEYEVGKRYSFWIHIMDQTSGSSETDLIDERFGFQFYVMGTLGLKFGIKAEVAVGLITTRIGSIGVNVEFGPYLRLWGYFIYYYEKLRPANKDEWKETEEMLGALYLEFGLYVTVKFKAQALENAYTYQPTLYNKEFPLLTAGVKQNVYDFALHPDSDDILYIQDADNYGANGISMSLPQIYQEMKTISLTSGEKKQVVYPRDKFIVTFDDSRFTIGKAGNIVVTPGDARYLKCNMHIVWKCDKVAFSKYDTDITVPVVWTNMTDAEKSEKFTASVMAGDPENGYHKVWSQRYGRLDTFSLPEKDEILKLLNYDSFNTDKGNVKYSKVSGYQTASTDLQITADTVYYFDITPRIYAVTVNGVQNTDGSITRRTYQTVYGETFPWSDLHQTGADKESSSEPLYSTFDHLYAGTDKNNIVDENTVVDLKYVSKYGYEASVNAEYVDDVLNATYSFVGIGDVAPVTVKFKRRTIPYYAGLSDYVRSHGGSITDISPVSASVESSITYTVNCVSTTSKATHTITFNTNGGSAIKAQEYFEDSKILQPSDPTRSGYTFDGWFSDDTLSSGFDFTSAKMGTSSLTVYAKWKAKDYYVSFSSSFSPVQDKKTIHLGDAYGDLPVLSDGANKFLGWFDSASGVTQITASSIFNQTSDQILYAHWTGKATISTAWIAPANNQTYTYDSASHAFSFTVTGHDELKASMAVQYKIQQSGAEWTSDLPQNAGSYDVKITRAVDNDYLEMAEYTKNSAVVINKAHMYYNSSAQTGSEYILPSTVSFTKGGVIVAQRPTAILGDGKVTYELKKATATLPADVVTVETNSTGIFSNLAAGEYFITVHVAEGTNYFEAHTFAPLITVSGNAAGPYIVSLVTATSDGTDSNITAGLYTDNQSVYSSSELDDPDDTNDFEKNDVNSCTIATGVVPWQIKGGFISKDDTGPGPDWTFTSKLVFSGTNVPLFEDTFLSATDLTAAKSPITKYAAKGSYNRNITKTGNFSTGGADIVDLTADLSSNSDYTYSYDGKVTDQYMTDYDALLYYGAPVLEVQATSEEFDAFIHYTGVTSFTIDRKGLLAYLTSTHKTAPIYHVSLVFPQYTTTNEENFNQDVPGPYFVTKDLTVKVPASLASAGGTGSGQGLHRASIEHLLTVNAAEATMKLSADDIVLNRGKYIDVNVSIEEDVPVWGIFNEASYDPEVLELIGTDTGTMFNAGQYSLQNNLSASTYKYMAVNEGLKTVSSKGRFITLHFRVKSGAANQDTAVSFKRIEASGRNTPLTFAMGDALQLSVDTTAPIIEGIRNGAVYYGDTAVTIIDDHLDQVTVNGKKVSLTDGRFVLRPSAEMQTVVATDLAGNSTTFKVKVEDGGNIDTGAHSQIPLWAGIFLGSLLISAAVYFYRRRRRS